MVENLQESPFIKGREKNHGFFYDPKVNILSVEGQLKACGCFFVLLIAWAGIIVSLVTIGHSFSRNREREVSIY